MPTCSFTEQVDTQYAGNTKKALYNGSRILSLKEPNICLNAGAERTAGQTTQGEQSTV